MYKNQLQELAQRSCFNLPSYACIREGPDHAPRFKASVNFHGEIFEGPSYCTTLRQAEHAAAEVALNNLSTRGTSRSLAARVLDETGVYKNLLQETAHRAGLKLPVYTTVRSGPGHQPVFTCSVELAGMSFSGDPAKTKKQAEKNAAMAAWSALKQMPSLDPLTKESESSEEQEQVVVARVLSDFKPKEEHKPMRQREQQQQQQRKRIMTSSHYSCGYRQQWRLDDLLSESSPIYQFQRQQKQRAFPSLPPSNGPKMLHPLPFLQEISSSSEDKSLFPSSKSIPFPLEELQKDHEEDWVTEISDNKGKAIAKTQAVSPVPAYPRAFPLRYQRTQQTHVNTRPFSPPPHLRPTIGGASVRNSTAIPIPRLISSGGFHAAGIAPAVNIRSVIPVCAVPPRTPPANTPVIHKKEPEEDIPAAISKLNKLQL